MPIIKKISERKRNVKIPHIRPQSRASAPLFFLMAIKPPKNDAVYIEKNDMGVRSECGFSVASPTAENMARSKIRMTVAQSSP